MALKAVAAPLGSPVGGTGTTNTIPRWTGPSTLGDSGLIDDGSQIYTTSRVLAVNTATTLGTGLIRFQVGSASALANYQGAQAGFMLPTGSGSWVEFCENSATGTTFRISKDASTGVVLNANGKNMGFSASGYTTAVASSQMVLLTTGNVGIGTASPLWKNHTVGAGLLLSGTAYNLAAVNQDQSTYRGVSLGYDTSGQIGVIASTGASSSLAFWTNAAGTWGERARIDSSGNLILNTANTGATIQAAGTQQGLKLPATPGNADTQTLDCYAEGTWTPTLAGFTGTTPTATTRYTRAGRLITIEIFLYAGGATFGSTFGTTSITLPLSLNAAMETCVPVAWGGGGGGNGAIGAGTNLILLPTNAATTLARITFTMSI